MFLRGANGSAAPLIWTSHKLKRVVKSSKAAETMALQDGAECAIFIKAILLEIFGMDDLSIPILCFTDNKSLFDNLQSSNIVQDPRLRVDIARIREMVQLGEIKVVWVDKKKQLADPLTKAGASTTRLLEVLRTGVI